MRSLITREKARVSRIILSAMLILMGLALPVQAAYDSTNAANVAALKAELVTDPAVLGYGTSLTVGDHGTPAKLLCQVRAGAAFLVDRELVPTYMLFSAVDAAEFATLTALQLSQLSTILSAGQVDLSKVNIRTMLGAIFPLAGPTRAAIVTLAKRQGSRAEVLFGTGSCPSNIDVSNAWRS